jgi:hypothetical protein
MATLIAYVANCLIAGDEITHHLDGSWIRDVVSFKCNKWEFKFRQHPNVVQSDIEPLKGEFCETSTVEVEGVNPNQVDKALETLEGICWLLSFACQSKVLCYGHEFEATKHFKSVSGSTNYFRPPIEIKDGAAVKSFIENTYPVFHKLNKRRKLSVIFDYLVQADKLNQPSEIRLLLLFVTLESLKDTYAREVGIPYNKGFYRKPAKKLGKQGESYKFEELLKMMLQSAGMNKGLKQVVELRNEIIHSGLSRKPHSRQWKMYERIQDIIREYLIRILNYNGEFFTYASQGMTSKKVN